MTKFETSSGVPEKQEQDLIPSLALCILLDYPIHIDTISMELSILYFKGLSVKISIKYLSVPEDCFYHTKQ